MTDIPDDIRGQANLPPKARRTIEECEKLIREFFAYDPDTGILTWAKDRPPMRAGSVAGGPHNMGYLSVGIGGRRFLVHRVIWFMVYGEWPDEVDHQDLDKRNNRISNLRNAAHSGNVANTSLRSTNTSGYKGVSPLSYGRYIATITKDYKRIELGRFDDPAEAHDAYVRAAERLFGEYARTE